MGRRSQQALALCLKTGTLLVSLSSGYGRNAYATSCTGSGGTNSCGPGIDVTQILSGSPLLVTTSSGFSSDTSSSGGDAFDLFATSSGITFIDDFVSTITGKEDAIVAVNYGSGSLTITTTGKVSATTGIGIWTDNRNLGTDTEINVASVTGGDCGIRANNSGNGHLWITATDPLEGINGDGIFAENGGNGTDLVMSATTVTGGSHGISATNRGSSILSITTTGAVTGGAYGIGIWANNYGTDLRITATSVTGGDKGILATNNGTGSLAITTSGEVSSTGNGALAFGIYAINKGNGSLSIKANDTVSSVGSGSYALGIYANNSINGTDLTISATDVTGGYAGIYANNFGSGTLSITTSGSVEATRGKAIVASTGTGSGDLTISAAQVKGSSDGIVATNKGSAALSISVSGAVEGTSGYGIIAQNDGGGATTLNVGRDAFVQGGQAGIKVGTTTGQSTTINVSGRVANLSGLATDSAIIASDSATTINLLAGSVTTGVIYLSDFSDSMTLRGTLDGSVSMNGGNDTLIQNGSATLTGTADGGSGTDNLEFNDMGTVEGSHYVNFENLAVYGGSTTLDGRWDFSTGQVALYSGNLAIAGSLWAQDLIVANGTKADINGSANINRTTTVAGLLDVDRGGSFSGNDLTITSGGAAYIDGIVTMSGASTFNGTLSVGSSGTFTTDTLTVGSSGTATITGTVTATSATYDYGTISVDGTLQTPKLEVEPEGLLIGNGTINGDVDVYGTVSPGHSIGKLTINGSLSFESGSSYLAELAANGNCDMIGVNGPVTINGGNLEVYMPQALYRDGFRWRIIEASGGINDSFSSIDTNFTSYTVDLEQLIQGGSLDLVVVRTPYAGFGNTKNQQAVGAALDAILPEAEGNMYNLMLNMDFGMNPSQLTATLEGLNPEMYTAFPSADLRMAKVFSDGVAFRQQELQSETGEAAGEGGQLWTVWGRALGDWFERESKDDVGGYQLDTGGFLFGMDRAIVATSGSMVRGGLVLGYGEGDLSWDGSNNSGDISGRYVGLYGSSRIGGLYGDAEFGYSDLQNNANRTMTTPLFSALSASSFDDDVLGGSVDAGYDFSFGPLRIGPVLAMTYRYLDQKAINENGLEDFSVHIDGCTAESFLGTFGVHAGGNFLYRSWSLVPDIRLAMVHQFKDDAVAMDASFVNYPDATFRVTGSDPETDSGLASVGIKVTYNQNLSLHFDYAATFSGGEEGQFLSGGIVWSF